MALTASRFQSRNRVSFGFKKLSRKPKKANLHSFNLVIEFLLVSSLQICCDKSRSNLFQSRNRVSFGFK